MEKEKLLAHETLFADIIRAFKENKTALFGLIVVVILVVLAIFAPYVTPYDPYEIDLNNRFSKPSLNHWFGTDMFGRDLFTRVIYGARISLAIGLIPSLIAVSIGAILGVVSGYIGGRLGYWVMRMADVVMAFPSLLLAIVVMYTLGATLFNLFIALSVVGWAGAARVVRSQALSIREKEFIEAAKAIGVKDIKINGKTRIPKLSALADGFIYDEHP